MPRVWVERGHRERVEPGDVELVGDVLLRIVRTPDAVWLDLGGLTSLSIPSAD